jgi:hypothetical protein
MAVIQFTPADALQTTIVQPGIYPSEVSKIEGPKASKSGKSNHYFVDIRITDGQYKDKEITVSFNTETNSPSLLGDMKFFPVSVLLLLDSAINNRKVVPEAYQLDTDTLAMRPFDSQWAVQTVDGRLVNDIVAFYPAGYGATAPTF